MQAGVAAGRRRKPREARAAQTGVGKCLQGDAVIGAAEPRASERGERCARPGRVEDRIARKTRLDRCGAWLLIFAISILGHPILPVVRIEWRRSSCCKG